MDIKVDEKHNQTLSWFMILDINIVKFLHTFFKKLVSVYCMASNYILYTLLFKWM